MRQLRQGSPLKQIRGTVNLVIQTGEGNPKNNVISILGISFENLNLFMISTFFLYDFWTALGPTTTKPVHAKENVEKKRFVHACFSALCEIVANFSYGFLQMMQVIKGSFHIL